MMTFSTSSSGLPKLEQNEQKQNACCSQTCAAKDALLHVSSWHEKILPIQNKVLCCTTCMTW